MCIKLRRERVDAFKNVSEGVSERSSSIAGFSSILMARSTDEGFKIEIV